MARDDPRMSCVDPRVRRKVCSLYRFKPGASLLLPLACLCSLAGCGEPKLVIPPTDVEDDLAGMEGDPYGQAGPTGISFMDVSA